MCPRGQLAVSGDTFGCHDWEGVLLATSAERTGMLFKVLLCTAQPQTPRVTGLGNPTPDGFSQTQESTRKQHTFKDKKAIQNFHPLQNYFTTQYSVTRT